MDNNAQHWHTRTPLRVRVLGLLFFTAVFVVLGVLWSNWGLFLGWYLGLSSVIGLLLILGLHQTTTDSLYFDDRLGFALLGSAGLVSVRIVHIWHSPLSLTVLCINAQNKKQQLVFWRGAFSTHAWRRLHIYLLHYQLQYQFADFKGAQ